MIPGAHLEGEVEMVFVPYIVLYFEVGRSYIHRSTEIATADDDYTKVLVLTGAAPATASGYKICPRADPFTLHASHT